MSSQYEPGEDILALRSIIEERDRILATEEEQREDWEPDFLAQVEELAGQFYRTIEEAADADPTMIHERSFVEYAQELAEDIGAIDGNATWPNTHIDWEGAARDLQMDYSLVTFGGHDYWIR